MPNQIIVAGAVIAHGTLLVAQRDRPPELAGAGNYPAARSGQVKPSPTRWRANWPKNSASRWRSASGWAATLISTPRRRCGPIGSR
ncbi:hypothetical protein I553_9369 [Mycobacterium xenopi 4042]|uniref:Uncharacterized protein n=1 Tax=Mycobacterium xenopi 4042 TaxID=1299334 RepID=X8DZV5_MYCXE|nr:hypothetical protein I553_9369 [Mycobacterium xenopi 4042]